MITITTEKKEVSKMRAKIEMLEAHVKYLGLRLKATENEDTSIDSADIKIECGGLSPALEEIMKDILSKVDRSFYDMVQGDPNGN